MYELRKTTTAVFKDEACFKHSQEILAKLGNPQNVHSSIHVAGTSGKGSVCYLIDAILRAHGKRTGLMVSPHVYDIRERIQVNGQMISERKFAKIANKMMSALQDAQASYYEALASLGFLASAQEKLDYLIVETGAGGLWDTTNAISRSDKLSVITQIGFDHMALLGNTIEKIATQKAGIIRPKGYAIIEEQSAEVMHVLEGTAKKQNAGYQIVARFSDYQKSNDAVAVATVKKLADRDGWHYNENLTNDVISKIFIPGRFEKREYKKSLIILDGAHNPQKIEALCSRLVFENLTPCTFILAIGKTKDSNEILKIIKPHAKRVIATQFFSEQQDIPNRPISANQLSLQAAKMGINSQSAKNPYHALQLVSEEDSTIVATGSFYLLSEVDKAM